MKKITGFSIAIIIIMLAIVPAFAAPACPYCSGVMSSYSYENVRPTGENSWRMDDTTWNPFTKKYQLAQYTCIPSYRDVYRVCNQNSSHKEFVRTERFILKQMIGFY